MIARIVVVDEPTRILMDSLARDDVVTGSTITVDDLSSDCAREAKEERRDRNFDAQDTFRQRGPRTISPKGARR